MQIYKTDRDIYNNKSQENANKKDEYKDLED